MISTGAAQQEGPGSIPRLIQRSFCVDFHVLLVSAWVSSGYLGFLPRTLQTIHVWAAFRHRPLGNYSCGLNEIYL